MSPPGGICLSRPATSTSARRKTSWSPADRPRSSPPSPRGHPADKPHGAWSLAARRLAGGETLADLPQPSQIVDVLRLGRDADDRHPRMSRGKTLREPALGGGELHPLRMQPQGCHRERVPLSLGGVRGSIV